MHKLCLSFAWTVLMPVMLPVVAAQGGQKTKPPRLADGFYLILKASKKAGELKPASEKQRVVIYDYKFLKNKGGRQPRYLLVRTAPDVPLILAEAPQKRKEPGGNASLGLVLKSEYAGRLLRFTTKHKDREVAFVIGGNVITAHRVREAIRGGRILVSRCSDNACEYLYDLLRKRRLD